MSTPKYPYPVGAVANYMIGRALRGSNPISYRRLERLIYLSSAAYYAVPGDGNKLFRERIEAWPWGPVVPAVYHEFKRYGPAPIRQWSTDYDFLDGDFTTHYVSDDDRRTLLALEFTWKRYAREPIDYLRHLTLEPPAPWIRVWRKRRSARPTIPDRSIHQHSRVLFHDIFIGSTRKTSGIHGTGPHSLRSLDTISKSSNRGAKRRPPTK